MNESSSPTDVLVCDDSCRWLLYGLPGVCVPVFKLPVEAHPELFEEFGGSFLFVRRVLFQQKGVCSIFRRVVAGANNWLPDWSVRGRLRKDWVSWSIYVTMR